MLQSCEIHDLNVIGCFISCLNSSFSKSSRSGSQCEYCCRAYDYTGNKVWWNYVHTDDSSISLVKVKHVVSVPKLMKNQQVYLTEMSVCAVSNKELNVLYFRSMVPHRISSSIFLWLLSSQIHFSFRNFPFAPLLFPSKSIIITKRALNTFASHTTIRSERKNRPLLSTSINRSYSCVIFVIEWRVYRWYSSIYLQQTGRKEYFAASGVQAVKKGK